MSAGAGRDAGGRAAKRGAEGEIGRGKLISAEQMGGVGPPKGINYRRDRTVVYSSKLIVKVSPLCSVP